MSRAKTYQNIVAELPGYGKYFSLKKLNDPRVERLPYTIRVLLESGLRNCDEFEVTSQDVENILDWENTYKKDTEVAFKPARVIMQDFTGVPAVVDLAAMRDAIHRLGGDAQKINPLVPSDLVIDHSVQVDFARSKEALEKNQEIEFHRNKERFGFLKWGSQAFEKMLIIPPGSGIVHQVNLEYLARVVFDDQEYLYPDSLVGTDSHTTMIDGLGVVGWGVGGIEAEAVMLGQPISMVLPEVIGFKLIGELNPLVTATDLVLTCTQMLRKKGVVGKFVEFFGPGVKNLKVADRATIANMSPEYGATMGFFPVDNETLNYLRLTGRSDRKVKLIEEYCKAQGLFRTYDKNEADPVFSGDILELDLATVVPSVAGPKRPHDCVAITKLKKEFEAGLTQPISFKGYDLKNADTKVAFDFNGKSYTITHGSIVIAAITSCTNTSNPGVLISAGLLAKNALKRGLNIAEYIKTSLSPGSGVAKIYLENAGLLSSLEQLGFYVAGYGCMTCIGNSGELHDTVAAAITEGDLVATSVLSGNRNFEGRVHPLTRANYLASPPLVIAYALAGKINIDFDTEPVGYDHKNNPVFLKEIWPSKEEILDIEKKCVIPELYTRVYNEIASGNSNKDWRSLSTDSSKLYHWDKQSTYINNPPFFQSTQLKVPKIESINKARCLLNLGDSITTDHISPASKIAKNSPAAKYLIARGVDPKDFNSYGSRRGNDEVMVRGTFANIRIVNKMVDEVGPYTKNAITNTKDDIYNVAMYYKNQLNVPSIILAGNEYGSGSSRDWAAKGPYLLGVRAVIAQSFERIHRSNLVGMGVLPLQFEQGQNADTLKLTGLEEYTIELCDDLKVGSKLQVKTSTGVNFNAIVRIDTAVEKEYFRHGGILQYTLRRLAA